LSEFAGILGEFLRLLQHWWNVRFDCFHVFHAARDRAWVISREDTGRGQYLAFVPSLDLVISRQTGSSGDWQFEEFLRRACAAVLPENP
jgi:hypothetical protein